MNSTFNPMIQSVQDLIKYKTVSTINTGDKTLDNMLNIFISSFLIMFFTNIKEYSEFIVYGFILFLVGNYFKSNIMNMNFISYFNFSAILNFFKRKEKIVQEEQKQHVKKKKFKTVLDQMLEKKIQYREISLANVNNSKYFPVREMYSEYSDRYDDSLMDYLKYCGYYNSVDIYTIGYTPRGHEYIAIGVCYRNNQHTIFYYASSFSETEVYKNYKEWLAWQQDKEENDNNHIVGIPRRNIIYRDRTMNYFISKHKKDLISLLENFVNINNETPSYSFNGFDSYNLGIILYGPPGTGKTSLMKAIANYIDRDLYIVDMKTIKNVKDFENLFWSTTCLDEYKKYVYVFEEFDCVQGTLSRDKDNNESTDEEKINKLNDTYIELLEKKSFLSPHQTELISQYDTKLKDIMNQIDEIKNKITIYNLLTTFDGIEEMRGRIIIATTNYIDRIDSALLRAGRFDIKIELGPFNNEEAKKLLEKMFANKLSETDKQLLSNFEIPENKYTPVEIMNIVYRTRNLQETLKRLI